MRAWVPFLMVLPQQQLLEAATWPEQHGRDAPAGRLRGISAATPTLEAEGADSPGLWGSHVLEPQPSSARRDDSSGSARGHDVESRRLQPAGSGRGGSQELTCEYLDPTSGEQFLAIKPSASGVQDCWEIPNDPSSKLTIVFRATTFAEGDTLEFGEIGGQQLAVDASSEIQPGLTYDFPDDVIIVFTAVDADAPDRDLEISYKVTVNQISTSFLFNSTLILLGFVWCGVTFARLVCVHRARENALNSPHFSDRRGNRGDAGAGANGGPLGAATSSGPVGLTPAQIRSLEQTTMLPAQRRFGAKLAAGAEDLEDGLVGGSSGGGGAGKGAGGAVVAGAGAGAAGEWGEDEATCAICLCEEEEGQKLRVLPCGHFFHSECVDVWLAQNPSCPFCKAAVEPPSDEAKGGGGIGGGVGGLLGSRAASVRNFRRWLRNHDRGSAAAVTGAPAPSAPPAPDSGADGTSTGGGGGGSEGGGVAVIEGTSGSESARGGSVASPGGGLGGGGRSEFSAAAAGALAAPAVSSVLTATDALGGSGSAAGAGEMEGEDADGSGSDASAADIVEGEAEGGEQGADDAHSSRISAAIAVGERRRGQAEVLTMGDSTATFSGVELSTTVVSAEAGADAPPATGPPPFSAMVEPEAGAGAAGPDPGSAPRAGEE